MPTQVVIPAPGEVHADVAIRGFKWSFDDDLAAELAPGLVVKLEIVARVEELRAHRDGTRWNMEVLEVGKVTD